MRDVKSQLKRESVFIVGSVHSISGRSVRIKVNKNKNASHLLFDGQVLKNISVNSYIKITKGFTNIIGKIEGESIGTKAVTHKEYNKEEDNIERFLEVSLAGYFEGSKFRQGIKEMPLVDNDCYLLDRDEFRQLHQFHREDEKTITIGSLSDEPAQKIKVSINQLFASHIGIFGNTGSGKSHTLAKIYYELFKLMEERDDFKEKSRFVIIDFNGEYGGKDEDEDQDQIITENKKVYTLSTATENGEDKIPLHEKDLIDIELLSILANATEKTQKPFIERTIRLYKRVHKVHNESLNHFKNSLRSELKKIYRMILKDKAFTLLDYFENIIKKTDEEIFARLEWHGGGSGVDPKGFIPNNYGNPRHKLVDNDIEELDIYRRIDTYEFPKDSISKFIHFLYLQIIYDVYNDKAQNDHIAPAINKLKSKQKDIEKVLNTGSDSDIFDKKNLIIINLKDVNTEIKKTLPLLIIKKLYETHKADKDFKEKSLHLIIDEAHNILSDKSARESESWKDYRLEIFEEIIKEGRKFNTFLTIASQRPQDISTTMISQLHNYFIHKLLNDSDINAIHKAVAYLDKLSFESIPILSVGSCFFAGVATNLPVKTTIDLLDKANQPNSDTVNLEKIWSNPVDIKNNDT